MKCIVTGGAGFIGSHLTEKLLNDGHSVTVIDNCSTGRIENLAHLPADNLNFVQSDITDADTIYPLFEGVDWVFHIAALADIVPSIRKPDEYHRANVDGTFHVLEASRKYNIKRFVYAASSSCYGIPDNYPTPESAPARPQYPYALTKYVGEQYVMHWAECYGLPAVSCRFFNVYGPRSRTSGTYGAVFGVFLKQKLADKPFTVVGDGKQSRDFTFVTDIVDGLVLAAKSPCAGEIFNLGTGQPQTILRLVELLGGEITFIPKRPGEPDCTLADNQKAVQTLEWKPKVSFEQGVNIMLENIQYWANAPLWQPDDIAKATEDWFKYLGPSS